MIEFKNVSRTYKISNKNKVLALKDINFKLPNKGMIFILGTSGSGKSTLSNLLGLLDKPNSGEIIIDGKLVHKFKQKEIDYYRNTYVGFVFQEYNLLENFNVNKNIEIALDLQKRKKNQNKVNEILQKIGLDGLEKRKIKELSGGQKQRVAIGRAIVKNPNMILADEPTGNLDSENSEQIFSLLKEISNNKLVVVVTHDIEFARKYADRIIEIKDGEIINDTNTKEEEYDLQDFSLVKSRLSLFKSISLSFANLKKKKLKLAIITLLITITFTMFGFFSQLIKFDIDRTHAETLIKEKEYQIEINKKVKGENFTTASPAITFTSDEVIEVKNKLDKDVIKVSKAVEDNFYLQMRFASESNPNNTDTNNYAYYELYPSYTLFLDYDLEKLNSLKLIGRTPNDNNEIIINKVLADFILKNGLLVWEQDKNGKYIESNYYPATYEDIINDNKKMVYGTSYLVISGIIDENMDKYESLKTTLSDDMVIEPTKLYEEYIAKYGSKISQVIVTNNFFDNLALKPNNVMPIDFYKLSYVFGEKQFYPMTNTATIDKKIKIYNGNKIVEIDCLQPNEVILGANMLDELFDGEYSKQLLELLQQKRSDYEYQVKIRDEKIKQIEKELESNPDYIYEYPPEIKEVDFDKVKKDFTYKYIYDKQIIGKTISVEVNDLFLRTQEQKTKRYDDFTIIGYSEEEIHNYYSKDSVFSNYMREKSETISIYFEEQDQQQLEKIFKEFPSEDSKYISRTAYSSTMDTVKKVVDKVSTIASYFAIFSLVFSIVLFTFFTMTSVNSNKKSIGILRALGAKTSDIYKVFYLESFLMGFVALILSSAGCYFAVNIANKLISSNLFINVSPIIFNPNILIVLLIVLVILTTISFVLPIFKISKTRPIDVINNK